MNYRTLEKIKIFSGLTAMAIIVMAWLYPVFFLLINALGVASPKLAVPRLTIVG